MMDQSEAGRETASNIRIIDDPWPPARHPALAAVIGGVDIPPALTGALRGILVAAGVAAVEAAIKALSGAALPSGYAVYLPLAILLLRTLEGLIDSTVTR